MMSREAVYELLDPETPGRAARLLRIWHYLAVTAGLAIAVTASLDGVWSSAAQPWLIGVVAVILAAFAVLYGLRLLVAGEDQWAEGEAIVTARWRYVVSPMGVVDLLGFLPMTVAFAAEVPTQQTVLFAVLWILKLARYSPGLAILGRVVRLEREPGE